MRSSLADTPSLDASTLVPHSASVGTIIATLMGWLPGILAVIPAIYYCVLIFESKTVQKWLRKRRLRKAAGRRTQRQP